MEIWYTARFKKDFRKLPKEIQARAIEKEGWFRLDPFDPRLKTHPLKGALAGLHSFSVSSSHRILFGFDERKNVEFYRIGKHDIYD